MKENVLTRSRDAQGITLEHELIKRSIRLDCVALVPHVTYINDIAGGKFEKHYTGFCAEAFIDTAVGFGEGQENPIYVVVHPRIYAIMKNRNLIDFIPCSRGKSTIPVFVGHEVIIYDGIPSGADVVRDTSATNHVGIYETWLYSPGFMKWAVIPDSHSNDISGWANPNDNGVLKSRQDWSVRIERNDVKLARLITREE